MHARNDIITSVGSLEVCAGHEAGCQSLIHAKRTVYEEESAEAVLVDTSNKLNSVNRNALRKLKYLHSSKRWWFDQFTNLRNGGTNYEYLVQNLVTIQNKYILVRNQKKCRRTRRIHVQTHQHKDHNRRQKTSRSSHRNYKTSTKLHERKNRPVNHRIANVM